MPENEILYQKIDKIISRIDAHKVELSFTEEINNRKSRTVVEKLSDEKLLEIFTTLLAYSGQAPSDKVKEVLDSGIFELMFNQFNVEEVAQMNPCDLVDKYWEYISPIRYQTKIFQIVMFARRIKKIGSLSSILQNVKIPPIIQSLNHIDQFWTEFDKMQSILTENKISYLKGTTTLLHFLLHTGFDSVKPDSVVMKVAKEIGIVELDKGDENFRSAVRFLQAYCLDRNIRPPVVDLYFLIHGGQKGARKHVKEEFYK